MLTIIRPSCSPDATTLRISLPPISLFSVFLFLFLFLFLSPYSLFAFPIRHPDEGMAERRQAPGRCEHPVVRAMTGTRALVRRPASQRRDARLSALHRGDFRVGPRFVLVLPPGPCGNRRT